MPFNIDLHSKDPNSAIMLTIDRNNLIIRSNMFTVTSASHQQRREFFRAFYNYFAPKILHLTAPPINMSPFRDETLHILEDHLCDPDHDSYHIHCKLNKLFDLETTNLVLKAMPRSEWLSYISEESYDMMLDAIEKYFSDPNYVIIEIDHQEERQKQILKRLRLNPNKLCSSMDEESELSPESLSLAPTKLPLEPIDTKTSFDLVTEILNSATKKVAVYEYKEEEKKEEIKKAASNGFYADFARNVKKPEGQNAFVRVLSAPISKPLPQDEDKASPESTITSSPAEAKKEKKAEKAASDGFYAAFARNVKKQQGQNAFVIALSTPTSKPLPQNEAKASPEISTIRPSLRFFFHESNSSRYVDDRAEATRLTQAAMRRAENFKL